MLLLYPTLALGSLIITDYNDSGYPYSTDYSEKFIQASQFSFHIVDGDGLKVPILMANTFLLQFREGRLNFPNTPADLNVEHAKLPIKEGDHFVYAHFYPMPPQSFLDAVFQDKLEEKDFGPLLQQRKQTITFQISKKQSVLQLAKGKFISKRYSLMLLFFVLLFVLPLYFYLIFSHRKDPVSSVYSDPCLNPNHRQFVHLQFHSNASQSHEVFVQVPKDCHNTSDVDPELYLSRIDDCLSGSNLDPSEWTLSTVDPEISFANGVVGVDACLLQNQ